MSSGREKRGPAAFDTLSRLWRLIQSVLDDLEPVLDGLGISVKEFLILEAVAEHPFPAQLARRMQLPPPTVTYLVKRLEGAGLLERRAEACDLRKFRLIRTPAGEEAVAKGSTAMGKVFEGRLRLLEPAEIVAFDRMVRRMSGAEDAED